MVTELFPEDSLALIIGIEVHVEGVDDACSVIIYHDATRLSSIRLPIRIRPHTFHPHWVCDDIVIRVQEYILPAMIVQHVQIIQCQWRRGICYPRALVRWVGVLQLRFDVRRKVLFMGLEVHDWG